MLPSQYLGLAALLLIAGLGFSLMRHGRKVKPSGNRHGGDNISGTGGDSSSHGAP